MLKAKEHTNILQRISVLGAFGYYLNSEIVFGRHYKNPLRGDKNPTCSFWIGNSNTPLFVDFGTGKKYTLIDFVKEKFGLSYSEAIAKIEKDAHLFQDQEVEDKPEKPVFSFIPGDIEDGMHYWKRYRIPKTIVAKYCFIVKSLYKNESFVGRSSKQNPLFAYKFISGRIKLYRPLSPDKQKKWGGNATAEDIGGLYQLPQRGQLLFITSSIKDIMVLKQHGFNAVALNGEGYGLSSDSYETIAPYITGLRKRFKKIVIFLDGDAAGVTFANKLSLRLKLPNIHLDPVFKDISDYQKHFGVVQTNRKIKKLLSKCLRT